MNNFHESYGLDGLAGKDLKGEFPFLTIDGHMTDEDRPESIDINVWEFYYNTFSLVYVIPSSGVGFLSGSRNGLVSIKTYDNYDTSCIGNIFENCMNEEEQKAFIKEWDKFKFHFKSLR